MYQREGLDRPVLLRQYDGETRTDYGLLANVRGDIMAVVSSSGEVVQRYSYSPFGERTVLDAEGSATDDGALSRFGHGGTWHDALSGLVWMRHRWYAPAMRRFLSPDPLEDDALGNDYVPFGNSPFDFTDPWGLASEKKCEAVKNGLFASIFDLWALLEGNNEKRFRQTTDPVELALLNQQKRDELERALRNVGEFGEEALVELYTLALSKGLAKVITIGTNKEAVALAKALGFKRVNGSSHGELIFKKGSKFISRDADAHSGGVWKMADSIENLASKNKRMGTYNADLTVRMGK